MGNVVRDTAAMMRFSQLLLDYGDSVGEQCKKMENALNAAGSTMNDDQAKTAITALTELIRDVKAVLTPVEDDVADPLSIGAKTLERVSEIDFTGRRR